jgi:hypothetical protein
MLENSCVAAQLAASQEGFSSMELVNHTTTFLHVMFTQRDEENITYGY